MEVASLRPELGLELFKLVLLRERYIARLTKKLKLLKSEQVDLDVIGLIDLLRDTSIQVVETVDAWEKSQVSYPNCQPFLWNGQDYLDKLKNDLDFLQDHRQISSWLTFNLAGNPFLIPSEIVNPSLILTKEALVVFGTNKIRDGLTISEGIKNGFKPFPTKKKRFKSPYITPIINDPEVYVKISAKGMLDSQFKTASMPGDPEKSALEVIHNPYQCYLSADTVESIRRCYKKLNISPTSNLIPFSSMVPESKDHTVNVSIVPQGAAAKNIRTEQLSPNEQLFNAISTDNPNEVVESKSSDLGNRLLSVLKTQTDSNYCSQEENNEFNRNAGLQEYSNTKSKELDAFPKLHYTHIWTPHEVHLKKQVQRRGGELQLLTAAGGKSRMKAPWRRTRFERMESDLNNYIILSDRYGMLLEDFAGKMLRNNSLMNDRDTESMYKQAVDSKIDVDIRKNFLSKQYKYFKMVAENGNLTDINKQRELHKLKEGQAREQDQQVSMQLEDTMIRKIQSLVRREFGRALRKAELLKRNKAATRIQAQFRRSRVSKGTKQHAQKSNLASMLQRLFRSKRSVEERRLHLIKVKESSSALFIQRIYRGFLHRKRVDLKRRLINSILSAKAASSVENLEPGHVEDLIQALEDYTKDYSVYLSVNVLSVLRGVFFVLNGDAAECVIVSADDGYTEKKFVNARSASWRGAILVLRRKFRFLRRLRAFALNSCLPNAAKINIIPDGIDHLRSIRQSVTEDDFDHMGSGGHCIKQLYRYLCHVINAYDIQDMFPEYFEPSLPSWFRHLMRIREKYDRASLNLHREEKTYHRIENVKEMHAAKGKKFSHISRAVRKNEEALQSARSQYFALKSKYEITLADRLRVEQHQLSVLEDILRARRLAREIAVHDLKEYKKMTVSLPDEQHINMMQCAVDAKIVAELQAQTELLEYQETLERFRTFRDFDYNLEMTVVYEANAFLGKVNADLLLLKESWDALIVEMEGVQYIKDLSGEKLIRFRAIRDNAIRLLNLRKSSLIQVESELRQQYRKLFEVILDTNLAIINRSWDKPNLSEEEHEEIENQECSHRDYEYEYWKRKQSKEVEISSPHEWIPFILVLDDKLPRSFIHNLTKKLTTRFGFTVIEWSHHDHNHYQQLLSRIQAVFQQSSHVIILSKYNYNESMKLKFDAMLQSIKNVLSPKPKIILYSGEYCFHGFDHIDKVDHSSPSEVEASSFDTEVKKIKAIGLAINYLMKNSGFMEEKKFQEISIFEQLFPYKNDYIESFKLDLNNFLFSIMENLKVMKKQKKSVYDFESKLIQLDLMIATSLTLLWNIAALPFTQWSDDNIIEGVQSFRRYLSSIDFNTFAEHFLNFNWWEREKNDKKNRNNFVGLLIQLQETICENQSFFVAMKNYSHCIDPFINPARLRLVTWIDSMIRYISK